ncbi:MAG: 23S rRNA (guanosine(2251)-2'-O)-methyltransferase RlmB, partial [Clostridia bacterium]|nr:23S rRNA (guanosine(2251)-2'-O)-methyltransferase RlmB [Clostridia bacterium]
MDLEKEFEKGSDIIAGRNPVSEAVNSGRAIDHLLVARGELNGSIKVIVAKAKEKRIPIKEVDRKKLDYMCGGAVHQGIAAVAAVKEYASVEDIFELAQS